MTNIVNPGAGANTPGMAEEMREMSREGRAARLVKTPRGAPAAPPVSKCTRNHLDDTGCGLSSGNPAWCLRDKSISYRY